MRNLFGHAPSGAAAIRPCGPAGRGKVDDQPSGGARRDRTDDLMLAKHALSQLSYGPLLVSLKRRRRHPSPWLPRKHARRPFGLAALRAGVAKL